MSIIPNPMKVAVPNLVKDIEKEIGWRLPISREQVNVPTKCGRIESNHSREGRDAANR
jgi:hypothetical protein